MAAVKHGTGVLESEIRPDAAFVHYLNITLYHQLLWMNTVPILTRRESKPLSTP